jgi:hypothetical protein
LPPLPSPESRCPEFRFASTVVVCRPVIRSGAWSPATLGHGPDAACSCEPSSSAVEPSSACGHLAVADGIDGGGDMIVDGLFGFLPKLTIPNIVAHP